MLGPEQHKAALEAVAPIKGTDGWPLTPEMFADATDATRTKQRIACILRNTHKRGHRTMSIVSLVPMKFDTANALRSLCQLGILAEQFDYKNRRFIAFTPYTKSWFNAVLEGMT